MRSTLLKYFLLSIMLSTVTTYNNDVEVFSSGLTTTIDGIHNEIHLWLTISAKGRHLEVSWDNAPSNEHDFVLLTMQEPHSFEQIRVEDADADIGSGFNSFPEINLSEEYSSSTVSDSIDMIGLEQSTSNSPAPPLAAHNLWISNNGLNRIVSVIKPSVSRQWYTTKVPFDFDLSRNVTTQTSCYGYWASYVDGNGTILAQTCIRAYPTWMNDMKAAIRQLRLRDLFIPGTHDSGSYRPNFEPTRKETIVTKYALTQDDDIRGQLMHGARYLDIRVGYYRSTKDRFFINHGITRQRPLSEIIAQVKDFVLETNEVVIFGLKEFPVGFGKTLEVHRLLVHYLQSQFGDLIVHPSVTWEGQLQDIWDRKQNIILAYDHPSIVLEYPQILFGSVEQRWGDVRTWPKLERHLRAVNKLDPSRLSSRPVVDMAELTPDTWGVITDKYGGLRKMADSINWRVSQLYQNELGNEANIVAADFIRGTTLIDIAIKLNKHKFSY